MKNLQIVISLVFILCVTESMAAEALKALSLEDRQPGFQKMVLDDERSLLCDETLPSSDDEEAWRPKPLMYRKQEQSIRGVDAVRNEIRLQTLRFYQQLQNLKK